MLEGTAGVGWNPECAENVTAKESVTHAVINKVSKVPSADMKGFTRAVAFGHSFLMLWLMTKIGVDLKHVIAKVGHPLAATPF